MRLERSPSISFKGSVWLHQIVSMLPATAMSTFPLPPCSIRRRMSSSTCMFQAKSNSPVWMTARAAEAASPPPFISIWSKYGRLAAW